MNNKPKHLHWKNFKCSNCKDFHHGKYVKYENGLLCEVCDSIAKHKYIEMSSSLANIHISSDPLDAISNIKGNIHKMCHTFVKLDEFETVALDQLNKISDTYIKKQHLDLYYLLLKKIHIIQYVIQKYYKSLDLCNEPDILSRQFKHPYFLEYGVLSEYYMASNNKIIDEYVASLETEDDVKIKLDNNFIKYNKIAERYTKLIDCIYEVIDTELNTEHIKKNLGINLDEDLEIYKCCKKFELDYPISKCTIVKHIANIMKKSYRILNIVNTIDVNIQSINDIKKTDMFDHLYDYVKRMHFSN